MVQLRMRHWLGLPLLPMPPLPEAYVLRVATPTDSMALSRVLEASFKEPWPEERVRQVLLDHPEVPKTFVVAHGQDIAATASYQVMPREFPFSGWVHYVGGSPAHAGKGLGAVVTLRVLEEAVARHNADVGLTTDDPRLAAIKTYLRLGFEPDIWHETHAARWRAVFNELGMPCPPL